MGLSRVLFVIKRQMGSLPCKARLWVLLEVFFLTVMAGETNIKTDCRFYIGFLDKLQSIRILFNEDEQQNSESP